MFKFSQFSKSAFIIFFIIGFIFNLSNAQLQLKITDFVLFGGRGTIPQGTTLTPPVAPGYCVQLGSSANIISGAIGSYTLIKSTGNTIIGGNIYSDGTINLTNNNTVSGNITAANTGKLTGTIFQAGSYALLKGNVDVNGNIVIGWGTTIQGKVTHTPGTTYSGPTPVGGNISAAPSLPVLPQMPAITGFTGGTLGITTTQTIKPGTYGAVALDGNKTLTLSGPGIYIFKSIKNKGSNSFVFDFANNSSGTFKIYVEGDVDLDKSTVSLKNGGDASRIYAETHGTGSTSYNKTVAWNISNCSTSSSSWLGTIWAPYAAINIGSSTGYSKVTGAFWSGTQVNVQCGVNINFAPYTYLTSVDTSIVPGYLPPPNGKSTEIIGPELYALCQSNGSGFIPSPTLYTIIDQNVVVEIVANTGQYDNLLSRLKNDYGMFDFIDNGPSTLIISGKIPIANLCGLNADNTMKPLINSCRPLFPGIVSSGITSSKGDSAMHADLVRSGYNLSGEGIKIGVLSDGYNTIPGNPANTDVLNGDLPGIGNPDHPLPVEILKEYPYGRVTDEGRAMLQTIHDIAPGSKLVFRTGYVSEGDFAQGIYALQQDSCDIITDDVTYLTAPFFKDGLAAKAVDYVKSKGVSYFSAAGNFANKAYENTFNPAAAPIGMTGFAHNFGAGDIFQNDSLKPGAYTIVLQWEDSIYSLGQGGALNDLDIYLVNDDGSILFGMNKLNTGGDPVEVLPFFVNANTKTNIMIVKASGPNPNVRFKFIVFRGDLKFNEYESGTSTLVGQANAAGAMAVGAARYTSTPAFGVTPPIVESFSSIGGTPVYGSVRNKPDFIAPDGGNTTVNFGSLNIEGDLFPNFFGTSAAAPHAAGVAALLLEGKKKFYNKALEPDSVRYILSHTSLNMATTGFDYTTGSGLIQADAVLASFAAPTPQLNEFVLPDVLFVPGKTSFTLKVKGKFFKPNSTLTLRGTPLPTVILSSTEATATIPAFIGNPPIQFYTPPMSPSGKDGNFSNSLYFFSTVKKKVIVTADNKTKKYGEQLPAFTANILVDSIPFEKTGLTVADLKLDTVIYSTPATSSSNVGIYFIKPSFKILRNADSAIFELYNYTFNNGLLSNNKMPLLITPRDTTFTYGDHISGFNFSYNYGDSLIPQSERSTFLSNLKDLHASTLNNNVTALVDARKIINGRTLTDADLLNMSVMASANSIINARKIINAKKIINGTVVQDTTNIVDLAVASIFNYQVDSSSSPLVSAKNLINARTIVNAKSIINGTAFVNSKTIINGSTILNSNSVGDTSNQNVVVIIDQDDVPDQTNTLTDFKSINMITGITAGQFTIVPAALISDNFEILYGLGKLTINQATLTVKADNQSMCQGDVLPKFTSTISATKNGDTIIIGPTYALNPVYSGAAGTYSIIPSGLQLDNQDSYSISYLQGTLYVNPKGGKTKNIKPYLDCVDTLNNDPSGFRYVANFSYSNDNATTIYIPIGENNSITSLGSYSGLQPEIFLPGGGKFKIPFDGKKLTWNVKTYNANQKTSVASDASSTSSRCKKSNNIIASSEISALLNSIPNEQESIKLVAYPNPTKGWLTISVGNGILSAKDIEVVDITGRKYGIPQIRNTSNQSIELELSNNFKPGVYFIKVKVDNSYKIFRIVKL